MRKREPLENALRRAAAGSSPSGPYEVSQEFQATAQFIVDVLCKGKKHVMSGTPARKLSVEYLRLTRQLDALHSPTSEAQEEDAAGVALLFHLMEIAEDRCGGTSVPQVLPALQLMLLHGAAHYYSNFEHWLDYDTGSQRLAVAEHLGGGDVATGGDG